MNVLGLDIGGANLKAVHSGGSAVSQSFAVWKNPHELVARLRSLADEMPEFDALALTMTAELCDCFATKRQGVCHVLDAVGKVCADKEVRVWSTQARWMDLNESAKQPMACAAANWHALASWLSQTHVHEQDRSLLIDVGSTTADIICLRNGAADPRGLTDTERLETGELVYMGVRRTPLAAVSDFIWLGDRQFATMAELFATTADVFVLTADIDERPDSTDTADGRPLDAHHAAARMLRMIGADLDMMDLNDARQLATAYRQLILARLCNALKCVVGDRSLDQIFVGGSGEFFAQRLAETVDAPVTRLSDLIGPEGSKCACAHALVQLWKSS